MVIITILGIVITPLIITTKTKYDNNNDDNIIELIKQK